MDDSEALERVAKMRAQKEATRLQLADDKKEFSRIQPDLENMLRQSRFRMNFMKTNRNVMTIPGSVEWQSVDRAVSIHSSFERWLKLHRQAEVYYEAAVTTGNKELIKQYKIEADKYLKECTFCSYKVGYTYNQFLLGADRLAGKHG